MRRRQRGLRSGHVVGALGVPPLLARHLCAAPDLVRGKRCVELAGIRRAVAAALGAARVVFTDVADAQPLLRRNAALRSAGGAQLWGDAAHMRAAPRN